MRRGGLLRFLLKDLDELHNDGVRVCIQGADHSYFHKVESDRVSHQDAVVT